jgi:hypothetical protein
VGQRAERALAEDPDAGGKPQQRRGVERDAKTRGAGGGVEAAQVVIAPSMERMAPVT